MFARFTTITAKDTITFDLVNLDHIVRIAYSKENNLADVELIDRLIDKKGEPIDNFITVKMDEEAWQKLNIRLVEHKLVLT